MKAIGTLASLVLALAFPIAPAVAAGGNDRIVDAVRHEQHRPLAMGRFLHVGHHIRYGPEQFRAAGGRHGSQ